MVNGCLRIKAELVGNRTALTEVFRTAPFHLGLPAAGKGGGAEVIVQEVGPGLLAGDVTETETAVGPGAQLTLRGQAATKLYPCPAGERIETTARLRVRAGGTLIHLPGELIPFKEAELLQRVEIDVESGGRVALAEIITPGRLAMGELDAYRHLKLRLHARIDGRLVPAERTTLDPAHHPPSMPGRRGVWQCLGTLWLIGFGAGTRGLGQNARDDAVWWGSGDDEQVTIVRCLGPGAQAIRTVIARMVNAAMYHTASSAVDARTSVRL